MTSQPIPTVPIGDNNKKLREKFYESIAAQSDLVDKLSERLLTLELAIPGLYATALKLVMGENATVHRNAALYLTFICWLGALVLTLIALIPKDWNVDPTVMKQDPAKFSEGLGIEDFFQQSARYKRRFVIASSILFFVGTISAVFTIG